MRNLICLIWSIGFGIGGTIHIIDIFNGGFLPYSHAPLWINAYWTSLTVLDLLATVLVWRLPKAGAVLGFAIMSSDMIINGYTIYLFERTHIHWMLLLQFLFGGFVLGSSPLLSTPIERRMNNS